MSIILKRLFRVFKQKKDKRNWLYFHKLFGAEGQLFCKQCSHITLIDVSRICYSPEVHFKTSAQCLKCGQFMNLTLKKGEQLPTCSCGGMLSKDDELFCPLCRGKDLQYTCYYFQ